MDDIQFLKEKIANAIIENLEDFKQRYSLKERRRRNDFCKEYLTDYTVPYKEGLVCVNSDKFLNEGLIKTYPTEILIKRLIDVFKQNKIEITERHFHISDWNEDKTVANYVGFFIPDYLLNDKLNDDLKQTISLCGYYIAWAANGIYGRYEGTTFQIEPKFQEDRIALGNYLYHVTTATKAKKIIRNGFYPKNDNHVEFNYDPRVYFFTTNDKKILLSYAIESRKFSTDGKERKRDFAILKIDKKQLNDGVKFFRDSNMPNNYGVFTYQYIPSSAIVDVEEINL